MPETVDHLIEQICTDFPLRNYHKQLFILDEHLSKRSPKQSLDACKENVINGKHNLLETAELPRNVNPYPGFHLIDVCREDNLQRFLSLVFHQKFAAIEKCNIVKVKLKKSVEGNIQLQSVLNKFIIWFYHQEVHRHIISALCEAVQNASDNAVVRNQICLHLLEWFKSQISSNTIRADSDGFIASSLCLVLCDVWSAIRSACASRLGAVIQTFSLAYLEVFCKKLFEVCYDKNSSWQKIEGCLLGLHCVVRRFLWTSHSDVDHPSEQFTLKFGKLELRQIPEFLSQQLPDILLKLLSHPQLSVREHSIRTYTMYFSKCELQSAMESFSKILSQLSGSRALPHHHLEMPVQDAYCAEGLLGVCLYFVKKVPSSCLEEYWFSLFSTLLVYLHHPASTVRQAASNVIKFMVAKESSSPWTLKRVLQGLAFNWQPNMEKLLGTSLERKSETDTNCHGWEWREGRLLTYELLMQFLIKNHWLYTFGPSYLQQEVPNTPLEMNDTLKTSAKRTTSLSETDKKPEQRTACPQPRVLIQNSKGLSSSGGASDVLNSVNTLTCDYGTTPHGRHYTFFTQTGVSSPRGASHNQGQLSLSSPRSGLSPASPRGGGDGGDRELASPLVGFTLGTQKEKSGSLLAACQELEEQDHRLVTSPHSIDVYTSQVADPLDDTGTIDREDGSYLERLSDLLIRVLYQTFECLIDSQWELRRMGYQLLPCLVEVIRWHDMQLLEDLWDKQLGQLQAEGQTITWTPMSYGACQALRHSLTHAAHLQHMVHHPPGSWQDHRQYCDILNKIVEPIKLKSSAWAATVHKNLHQTSSFDKAAVVAMETLMIVQLHFKLMTREVYSHLNRIVTLTQILYMNAHPDTDLAQRFRSQEAVRVSHTPTQGLLTCCMRPEHSLTSHGEQVERYFLQEVEHVLPHFLRRADVILTHSLLPVLCDLNIVYFTRDTIAKTLHDSIVRLTIACNHYITSHDSSEAVAAIKDSLAEGLEIICGIFPVQFVDQHSLRQLYELIAHLCETLTPDTYLQLISVKVLTRMPEPKVKTSTVVPAPISDSQSSASLVGLMNGDDGEESSSEDEEQVQLDGSGEGLGLESQTMLDASGNSGTSGQFNTSTSHTDAEDSGSDWDSWEEDEEEQKEADAAFVADLLHKLKASAKKATKSEEAFDTAVSQLSLSSQAAIKKHLKTS